jgi:dolichol kinase
LTEKRTGIAVASILLIILGVFEVLRIRGLLNIDIVARHTKDKEKKRPLGSFFYVLSGLIVIALFDKSTAAAALFTLSISDPLSSIVGSKFGRVRLREKTLEGTLTFFLSSLCIFLAFSYSVPVCIVCAAISSLTELLSGRHVDDNLSIPLVTACALKLLTSLM